MDFNKVSEAFQETENLTIISQLTILRKLGSILQDSLIMIKKWNKNTLSLKL